ncbi:MAG: hypothetical protein MR866_05030 [Selenomonadaceae bacterium]|nr:hypothetical protein [Selenomonadaceae bacterium]
MQKKKIMLGLAVFAALNVGNYAIASDNPFATVPQKTGYYQDVASLVHAGLIDGYTDADFNAKHPLTRYEMAVFTAKAMSNSQNADADNTQRIQKLMKEFQSELTDMHVRVPGVKAKKASSSKSSAKGPKIKKTPANWDVSGLMRFRLDGGRKDYGNGTGKHGADGFGGQKNKQLLWQMFNKFDIGGGWKGELDFIGAKDGNGDKRCTGENTDGYADVNKIFATGPIGKMKFRVGRMKGSFIGASHMVMGQYYEGIDSSYKTGKWTLGATWGKVDYTNNSFTGDPNAANSSVTAKATVKKGKYLAVSKSFANNYSASQVLNTARAKGLLFTDKSGAAAKAATSADIDKFIKDDSSVKLFYVNTTTKDIDLGNETTYYYKAERGVSDSDMNPPGLGVNMTQLEAKYQARPDLSVDFGWYHLHGNGDMAFNSKQAAINNYMMTYYGVDTGKSAFQKYPNPDIGEINVNWQATKKFNVVGHVAMSNMRGRADNPFDGSKGCDGDKNKAYAVTFKWGKVQPTKSHSRQFQLDLIHMEQFTGIKSTYDLKNKTGEGQQGLIADYRYIPVKNVMFDFRWMHYRTLGLNSQDKGTGSKNYHGNQYRFQLYYYF